MPVIFKGKTTDILAFCSDRIKARGSRDLCRDAPTARLFFIVISSSFLLRLEPSQALFVNGVEGEDVITADADDKQSFVVCEGICVRIVVDGGDGC